MRALFCVTAAYSVHGNLCYCSHTTCFRYEKTVLTNTPEGYIVTTVKIPRKGILKSLYVSEIYIKQSFIKMYSRSLYCTCFYG